VTEHFRERTFSKPIILLGTPLVNYAETVGTARSKSGVQWSIYQCLLIGSVFMALPHFHARKALAKTLWSQCVSNTSPRAVTLVTTGFLMPKARILLCCAPLTAMLRFFIWAARRPWQLKSMLGLQHRYIEHLQFLTNAPLTQRLIQSRLHE
jgi:hypothetical protein